MERVMVFLPSVLVIATIGGITLLYIKWVIKRYGDNFKSVEWHQRNVWKVAWTVGTPLTNVYAPTLEELIFRAPIIIAFSSLSPFAWYGILASSVLFAFVHWFGKKILMLEIFFAQEKGESKSDNVESEIERLHQESDKDILIKRIFHVVMTFLLGILTGYYGIKYQSVWLSVGIHSAWNLIMPAVLPMLVILAMLGYFALLSLWDKVRPQRQW